MNKKYEPTNVSEVEEHISLKYEIKKRLGKGVSEVFFFFPNRVEIKLKHSSLLHWQLKLYQFFNFPTSSHPFQFAAAAKRVFAFTVFSTFVPLCS